MIPEYGTCNLCGKGGFNSGVARLKHIIENHIVDVVFEPRRLEQMTAAIRNAGLNSARVVKEYGKNKNEKAGSARMD